MNVANQHTNEGLYNPEFEHDACGIGFVANIKGNKSHRMISDALTVLENMEHRGACGCENNTGDGAGILLQMPHEFFFDECLKQGIHLPSYGKIWSGRDVLSPKTLGYAKNAAIYSTVLPINLGLKCLRIAAFR